MTMTTGVHSAQSQQQDQQQQQQQHKEPKKEKHLVHWFRKGESKIQFELI